MPKAPAPEFVTIETAHHGAVVLPIERSGRRKRSLAITTQKNGQICLQVPRRLDRAGIDRFVREQSAWLTRAVDAAMRRHAPAAQNHARYLGKDFAVRLLPSPLLRRGGFCELHEDEFHIHVPEKVFPEKMEILAHKLLEEWYRNRAAEIFRARADYYAPLLGVRYKSIKIIDHKSRWGACDRHGALSLSWRVVMTPVEIIDYLIVHELAHLLHFNHSPAYWRVVAKILPDYKARRKKLEEAKVYYQLNAA